MSDIKINELLSQIRSISSQVQPNINIKQDGDEKINFSSVLKSSIDKVNQQQMTSSDLVKRFEQGDASVELSRVMIEMQKARVSFEAVKQVRNQLINAYKDVMSMPV
jgi:flagellar hook-basal body complex protein FliE